MKARIIGAAGVFLIVVLLLTWWLGHNAKKSYHFSAYSFDTRNLPALSVEGLGKRDICEQLFMPPQMYSGRYIPIPTNAEVFGVIAVTDGETSKVVPLFAWTNDKGQSWCGCNGPSPWYAREAQSKASLVNSFAEDLKAD